jgi:ketosteroid isomerase-like protein
MLVMTLLLLLPCLTLGQTRERKEKAKPARAASMQQAVERLDDEILEAARKGDAAFFDKVLADDYVRISPTGQMNTKAETVELYKAGKLKAGIIELKNRKVRVFGNTAIVTREVEEKGKVYRSTLVFVKMKNGQWQLVTFQATKEQ